MPGYSHLRAWYPVERNSRLERVALDDLADAEIAATSAALTHQSEACTGGAAVPLISTDVAGAPNASAASTRPARRPRHSRTTKYNMQNTSHAAMSQRMLRGTGLDDFPTPPWAVRALIGHVIRQPTSLGHLTCLEPACGRGHTASAPAEYFNSVEAFDIHPYGFGDVDDFMTSAHAPSAFDWIITSPPFRLAEAFIMQALPIVLRGVAMLSRTVFVEGIGRYERMYAPSVSKVAQFTEWVPMVQGRDRKASITTGYAWMLWQHGSAGATQFCWIPPGGTRFERDDDYSPSSLWPAGPGSEVDNDGEAA